MPTSSFLFTFLLVVFSTTLYALNTTTTKPSTTIITTKAATATTKAATTTTKAATTTTTTKPTTTTKGKPCYYQTTCPTNYFCHTQAHTCVLKRSVNSSCAHDYECLDHKCHDSTCRKKCSDNNGCSLKTQYCSSSKYCTAKHCGLCLHNSHCASNACHLFTCSKNCTAVLKSLHRKA